MMLRKAPNWFCLSLCWLRKPAFRTSSPNPTWVPLFPCTSRLYLPFPPVPISKGSAPTSSEVCASASSSVRFSDALSPFPSSFRPPLSRGSLSKAFSGEAHGPTARLPHQLPPLAVAVCSGEWNGSAAGPASASSSSAATSRSSSSNMSSSVAPWWTTLEVGPSGTLLYRVLFLDAQYRAFSPWHDIPLHVSEYPSNAAPPSASAAAGSAHPPPSGLSFLCVTPRGTWATYEVAQDENFNPIRLAKRNAAPAHFAENCHWNLGIFTQTWADPAAANEHLSGLHYDARPLHVLDISRRAARPGDVYPVKPLAAFAVVTLAAPGAAASAAAAAPEASLSAGAGAGGAEAGAPMCVSWNVVAVASDDPLAKELQDVADVSKKLPGVLEEIREWLRLCECKEAGDEGRVFGFNDRALGRKHVDACIADSHAAWQRLQSSLQKPEPWLPRAQPPKITTIEAFWAPYTSKYSEGACNADDGTPAAIPQSNPNAGAVGAASLSPLSAAADSPWETMPAAAARSMLAQLRSRKHLARPAFFAMRERLEMGDVGKLTAGKGAGKASKSGGRSKGKSAMGGSGRRDASGESGGGSFGLFKKGHGHGLVQSPSGKGLGGVAAPAPPKPATPPPVKAELSAPGAGASPAAPAAVAASPAAAAAAAPAVVGVAAAGAVVAAAAAAAATAAVTVAGAGADGAAAGVAAEGVGGTTGSATAAEAASAEPAKEPSAAAAAAAATPAETQGGGATSPAGACAAAGLAPVGKGTGGTEEGERRRSSDGGVTGGGAEGVGAEAEGRASAEKAEGGRGDDGEQTDDVWHRPAGPHGKRTQLTADMRGGERAGRSYGRAGEEGERLGLVRRDSDDRDSGGRRMGGSGARGRAVEGEEAEGEYSRQSTQEKGTPGRPATEGQRRLARPGATWAKLKWQEKDSGATDSNDTSTSSRSPASSSTSRYSHHHHHQNGRDGREGGREGREGRDGPRSTTSTSNSLMAQREELRAELFQKSLSGNRAPLPTLVRRASLESAEPGSRGPRIRGRPGGARMLHRTLTEEQQEESRGSYEEQSADVRDSALYRTLSGQSGQPEVHGMTGYRRGIGGGVLGVGREGSRWAPGGGGGGGGLGGTLGRRESGEWSDEGGLSGGEGSGPVLQRTNTNDSLKSAGVRSEAGISIGRAPAYMTMRDGGGYMRDAGLVRDNSGGGGGGNRLLRKHLSGQGINTFHGEDELEEERGGWGRGRRYEHERERGGGEGGQGDIGRDRRLSPARMGEYDGRGGRGGGGGRRARGETREGGISSGSIGGGGERGGRAMSRSPRGKRGEEDGGGWKERREEEEEDEGSPNFSPVRGMGKAGVAAATRREKCQD
ncbi:unnamed protein product [Closterium sp. NIES-53]